MHDHSHTHSSAYLHPSGMGTIVPGTPSGLTPNTRSEAEAALALNSLRQTDSAAPTTPYDENMHSSPDVTTSNTLDEPKGSYRRSPAAFSPPSANYAAALAATRAETSASSDLSTHTAEEGQETPHGSSTGNLGGVTPVASPSTYTPPFPAPGQGVVPLGTGIGAGQAAAVKRAKPTGLSLGDLGRRSSWNQQDMRHVLSAGLMGKVEGDAGYSSGVEDKEGK